MNIQSFLIIFLLITTCNKQAEKAISNAEPPIEQTENQVDEENCETGTRKAQSDHANGELGLYLYGGDDLKFKTWLRIIREEYGLVAKSDVVTYSESDCYNEFMTEKIEEKYGDDFFDRVLSKVDSLYEVGLGDRIPEFRGGDTAMLNYIYCNIEDEFLSNDSLVIPRIIMKITFDENGTVINEGIIYKNQHANDRPELERKANEIIAQMPDWKPAIENKKSVPFSYYNIPITFALEIKRKYCNSN